MNNHQDGLSLWQYIVSTLKTVPQDIQTVRHDGSGGIWFYGTTHNNAIVIDRAKEKQPSSSINAPRFITEAEFTELYPLYYQWKADRITRVQVAQISQNSSYIFALIYQFENSMR